jgi:2,3-bisphosphoglycerate-dependent phosphoglycerate mutase
MKHKLERQNSQMYVNWRKPFMTTIFFVRHAQPEFAWENDKTRPLTEEGMKDTEQVLEFFRNRSIDTFYCSPYKRSIDTIKSTADYFHKEIILDERLREREKGLNGNNVCMFQLRWADHDYHEHGGESIAMVQERNIAALTDILAKNANQTIVIGTHGTALSSIIHYYKSDFGCNDFLRIIDWMPYIIEMDFEGSNVVSMKEHIHIQKVFQGKVRADRK